MSLGSSEHEVDSARVGAWLVDETSRRIAGLERVGRGGARPAIDRWRDE